MTKEEKDLLIKDLCARLPYGVKGKLHDSNYTAILKDIRYSCFYLLLVRPLECPLTNDECSLDVDEFKPYLRPMSSMTEEEFQELHNICPYSTFNKTNVSGWIIGIDGSEYGRISRIDEISKLLDWLNKNMFDFRGLIPMGLALVAPEGMYENE